MEQTVEEANFKHKGNLILWNKPSKRRNSGQNGLISESECVSYTLAEML